MSTQIGNSSLKTNGSKFAGGDGTPGTNGENGGDGTRGTDGSNGGSGGDGGDGGEAGSVTIYDLDLVVNLQQFGGRGGNPGSGALGGRGGNGGAGGQGGAGGIGGAGGRRGNGQRQYREFSATSKERQQFRCSAFNCGTKGYDDPVYSGFSRKLLPATICCYVSNTQYTQCLL